ncbi:MAG: type II secretion system F family protein, partial [Terriglobia bacterium]
MPTIQLRPATMKSPTLSRPVPGRESAAKGLLSVLSAKKTAGKVKLAAASKRPKGSRVSAKDLAVFTRQFSVMIDAGLPLVQCLEILASQQEDKKFAKALSSVRSTVEGGATLANSLRKHPKVFDDLYTNM